jgi:hypothetical protein
MSLLRFATDRGRLVLVVGLLGPGLWPGAADAQSHGLSQPVDLRVDATGLPRTWKIESATLAEGLNETMGTLTVRHTGEPPRAETRFYAEYFDSEKRFCFSLVFLLNGSGLAAAGSRTIIATAPGMAAAARAVELRIREVSGTPGARALVSCPPTIRAGSRPEWQYLNVDPGSGLEPVTRVALAKISVDELGTVRSAGILQLRDSGLGEWIQGFIRQLRFAPEMRDGVAVPSTSLLLVRLVNKAGTVPVPASQDPWVKAALATWKGTLPVIHVLRFESPAAFGEAVSPLEASTKWLFVSLGTDWSTEALQWAADPDTLGR